MINNTTIKTLYILTPLSQQPYSLLVKNQIAQKGDLIADFSIFPPSVYQVEADQTWQNITSDLVPAYD